MHAVAIAISSPPSALRRLWRAASLPDAGGSSEGEGEEEAEVEREGAGEVEVEGSSGKSMELGSGTLRVLITCWKNLADIFCFRGRSGLVKSTKWMPNLCLRKERNML